MPTFRYVCRLLVIGALVSAALQSEHAAAAGHVPAVSALDVVDAVNVMARCDIGIAAASSTGCAVDRLPGSRAALVALVPGDHRLLIEECARGRTRLRRRQRDFDLLELIDEPAEHPEAAAAVRAFFTSRPVDVATGTGLSDGPYPIRFDWVVVLDPRSRTLTSFVLNCRD